jgi:hypothetical protein
MAGLVAQLNPFSGGCRPAGLTATGGLIERIQILAEFAPLYLGCLGIFNGIFTRQF